MNIIVCVKQVQHTYARTGNAPEDAYIAAEDRICRINPHDESALELALRLKDRHEGVTVTLLTLGPIIAPGELARCSAAGADECCQIAAGGGPDGAGPLDQPDPWVKSRLLARAAEELKADLVLCGKESIDKAHGQVGAWIAHRLDRPFVSAITDLSLDEAAGLLRVQRSAGRGVREIIECRRPAVFSVDTGADLRMPTFADRKRAEATPPRRLDYGGEEGAPKLVCTHRFQPRPRPKLVPAPDSRWHAYERIMHLLTGSRVEKTGEMLTGDPAAQVEGIVAFLKAHGFLEPDTADQ